ncbi:coiled-coil domain-containing protein [Bacillus paranthracis]|uniref:hypothetical protein n=1 Tax=Bacillus paranthracis TaxID=2026186 RepID=UPI00077861ED|nr:hypothetical protein [Bacillus paranthracis]KXY13847.1 hypothetical protein AT271_27745 [Bacillus cereus]MCC2438134.1 hypothetical protein [Bacillus paranthracis]MDG1603784.1 hypothetical protein [Bacillus paranthracis]
MGIKTTLEQANEIIEKYEGKRLELQNQLVKLDEDIRYMQGEVEVDFQNAVMNGGSVNTRLKNDLDALLVTRSQVVTMLRDFDGLLQNALTGLREEVQKETQSIVDGIRNREAELEKELKDIKLTYLQKVVQYHDEFSEGASILLKYRQLNERLGLREVDIRGNHIIDLDSSVQRGNHFKALFDPTVNEVGTHCIWGNFLMQHNNMQNKNKENIEKGKLRACLVFY